MRHPKNPADRRAHQRFPIAREIRYRVMDQQRVVAAGTGNTIDMSSHAVAFAAAGPMTPGAFAELSISWPVALDNGLPLRLVVYGRVTRTAEGMAVCSIERYEFRTQARAAAAATGARSDAGLRRWVDVNTRFESRSLNGL